MVKNATFVTSAASIKDCPKSILPEYAFFGRSNVGKSSLINMLTGNSTLAKVSATPGKTQLLNYYLIDGLWHLVDLPGYGYAKVSKSARKNWEVIIKEYLVKRRNMLYIFVLIDIRHEAQANDTALIEWLGENGIPFCIIFTKSDKISKTAALRNVEKYKNVLKQKWEELPPTFISSSSTGEGKNEILNFIDNSNREFSAMILSE